MGVVCYTAHLIGSYVPLPLMGLVDFSMRLGNWSEVEHVYPITSEVRRVIRICPRKENGLILCYETS